MTDVKPKPDPKPLSTEYHKVHKQLMLWSAIPFGSEKSWHQTQIETVGKQTLSYGVARSVIEDLDVCKNRSPPRISHWHALLLFIGVSTILESESLASIKQILDAFSPRMI